MATIDLTHLLQEGDKTNRMLLRRRLLEEARGHLENNNLPHAVACILDVLSEIQIHDEATTQLRREANTALSLAHQAIAIVTDMNRSLSIIKEPVQ